MSLGSIKLLFLKALRCLAPEHRSHLHFSLSIFVCCALGSSSVLFSNHYCLLEATLTAVAFVDKLFHLLWALNYFLWSEKSLDISRDCFRVIIWFLQTLSGSSLSHPRPPPLLYPRPIVTFGVQDLLCTGVTFIIWMTGFMLKNLTMTSLK